MRLLTLDWSGEDGVTELNQLGERPSFGKFLKVAKSLFPRAPKRITRKLGEGARMRPEDALSFNPPGGNVSKLGRVYMVPSVCDLLAVCLSLIQGVQVDDVILAKKKVEERDNDLARAKDEVVKFEDSLQKLKWQINADKQREGKDGGNATATQLELSAAEDAVTQAEAGVVNATDALAAAKATASATAVGAAREVFYTTDGCVPFLRVELEESCNHLLAVTSSE